MTAYFLKLASRFDALQLRERWLVVIAVLGGIVLIGHGLFVAPAQTRARLAEQSLAEQQAQLAALNSDTGFAGPRPRPECCGKCRVVES